VQLLARVLAPRERAVFFCATAGFASFIFGISEDGAARAAFVGVGIFLWAIAGTAHRLENLAFRVLGVSLEARLSKKEHGDEFAEAAKEAPDSVLEAVIPLLREDVGSDVVELGPSYDGKRLVDPELAWLRPELNITVFAINRPGDGDRWTGGGRVSELQLPAGTKLALVGERADIAAAAERLSK
jgi:hypothetical protein